MKQSFRLIFFILEMSLRLALASSLVLLWGLPASYFDGGEEVCYWKINYGIECPGCGLTRGTQHALHGEWDIAADYNPLSLIVGVGLMMIWLLNWYALYRIVKRLPDLHTPTQKYMQHWLSKLGIVKQEAHPEASTSS
ncbi:MAG: DUF2752 domain-containing protein [Bacteroidia bacterium]